MAAAPFALIGTALSVTGSFISARAQQRAATEQTRAAKRSAAAQEQQVMLDSQQRRRQSIRQGIAARAMSLTAGTAQGATGSSALAGAMAAATGTARENVQVINSAETLGGRVFQAERDAADARIRGMRGQALGQGVASIGGAIASIGPEVGRLTGR